MRYQNPLLRLKIVTEVDLDKVRPNYYVYDHAAEIVVTDSNEDAQLKAEKIGVITGYYLSIDLWYQDGVHQIAEVLATHSVSLEGLYGTVVDNDGIKVDLIEDGPLFDNILYLNLIEIRAQKYFDLDLLHKAVAYFIRSTGKETGIVVVQPSPFGKKKQSCLSVLSDPKEEVESNQGTKLFEKVGFKWISGTPFMYLDPKKAILLPDGSKI